MSDGATKRLLIVVNDPAFFVSHRLPVASAAREAGWDVHIATAGGDAVRTIAEAGFPHHPIPLSRSGVHPLAELPSLFALWQLFRRIRPELVHLVTAKPVLYGGIAARLAGVPAAVFAVSGLGFLVADRPGVGSALTRGFGRFLYRLAFRHPRGLAIVQHETDRQRLDGINARATRGTRCIPGSGVDLDAFDPSAPQDTTPLVVLPARMLRTKGVEVFAEAGRILQSRGVNVRCALVGQVDAGNPDGLDEAALRALEDQGGVEWWGFADDMPAVLGRAAIVCLPSFYGEGIPKTLIDAAAAGRAVVTTDWPGCRDAVVPNESALLVPPRDATALADALEVLIANPDRRQVMGRRGRQLAEERYGIDSVVAAHLAVYRELCSPGN